MDYRHLATMTDQTGIIQFCVGEKPDINSGYTTDDNARALLVALNLEGPERERYAATFARFLDSAQRENGKWHNLKLEQGFVTCLDSQDSIGRAFLACCIAAGCDIEEVGVLAHRMVIKALPIVFDLTWPRSMAYALLGITRGFDLVPEYQGSMSTAADEFCRRLIDMYNRNKSGTWRWFEDSLTYCNAILPHSLFAYHSLTGDRKALLVAEDSLGFLSDQLFAGGYLNIVGNRGWYLRGGNIPFYDQQPVDACSVTLACLAAFEATGKKDYLSMAETARAWYWGKNINQVPLYNPETGGCYDGLIPDGININQGAEALVSLLLTEQAWQKAQKGSYMAEDYRRRGLPEEQVM